MELRKIQKTGGSTFIVSLPKNWVLKQQLEQGSILSIKEQEDGALLILPTSVEKQKKKTTINAGENLQRKLTEKYLLGHDIIEVNFGEQQEKQKKHMKKWLNHFIGFEIVEETADTILIKNLLNPEEVSIMKSLRRMFTIVAVMHKDLVTAFKENNKQLLKDVIQRDVEVNRLYFLIVRQIRTTIQNSSIRGKEGISAVDCIDYRLVANHVENIADSLEAIAREALSDGLKPVKKITTLLESALEVHTTATKALLTKDETMALEVQNLYKKISAKKTVAKNPHQAKLLNNLLKILEYSTDLADMVVGE